LLGSNKLFSITPVTFEDAKAAKQNELVINYQIRTKLNRVKLIDELVHSVVDDGTAIVRVGWKRNVTKVMEEVPVYSHSPVTSEQELEIFKQALELSTSNPREFEEHATPELKACVEYYQESGEATLATQTSTSKVEVEKVLENRPTIEILNPANVYLDPTCNGDMDKALFVIVSFETNKAELLKEPERYKNVTDINWDSLSSGYSPNYESSHNYDAQFKDTTRRKAIAYEYWGFYDIDGSGKLTPIVATWVDSHIIRMELNPYPDGKLPFIVIPYLPVKRSLYGEPDAELLEDHQKISGAITRGMIDLMGLSANSQRGVANGFLDPVNHGKFFRGEDYEFNPNIPSNSSYIEHKYPEIPQSAMLMLSLQNQEAESLTGVKAFSGGISGSSYGDLAAGVRGALDASSKREMAILRRIAQGISEMGSKIVAMNSMFLSDKEVIRVTNEEFVDINREELYGNFDLDVDISTAEVDAAKSQDLAYMLQTLGNNMDFSVTKMILANIARLKRMPELADKLDKFEPQVSEEQQQLQALELQKAQLEVTKLESEIAYNNARAAHAVAMQEQLQVNTQEQVSGVSHQRAVDTITAQSRGNQNASITKALTTPTKIDENQPNIDAAIGFNSLIANGGTL
jgi:hypothetical protein